MARKKGKLEALQRTYEVEERNAIEHKRQIDIVVEQRRTAVVELVARKEEMEQKISELCTKDRAGALVRGDAEQLIAVSRYRQRLSTKLAELAVQIEQREQELKMALERFSAAEEEVVSARVDKKKVERFLEQQAHSVRVRDAAVEEVETDESNFYRRKK